MPRFVWYVERRLAGMPRPGVVEPLVDELRVAVEHGIAAVVSLTESPLERAVLRELGLAYEHLPIPDFSTPTDAQVDRCVELYRSLADGDGAPPLGPEAPPRRGLLVHCAAGLGRSGTMAACCLVADGVAPADAIILVRSKRPGSIETTDQEGCVHAYAARLSRS